MLSDKHLLKHAKDFVTGWTGNVGRTGLTANTLGAMLGESPVRVASLLAGKYDAYYCHNVRAVVWKREGVISSGSYEANGSPMPAEQLYERAIKMAEEFGPVGFVNHSPALPYPNPEPSDAEACLTAKLLKAQIPEGEMTDETCVYCKYGGG